MAGHPFEQGQGGRLVCRCGKVEAHGVHHGQRVHIRLTQRYTGTGALDGFKLTARVDGRIVEVHDIPADTGLVQVMRRQIKERVTP